MLTAYTRLFNIVFSSGIIPDDWSKGIISPIYKNKGDKANPDNYRGITIKVALGNFSQQCWITDLINTWKV